MKFRSSFYRGNHLSATPFDQHSKKWCGACYLVAAIQMVQDRFNILMKRRIEVSLQAAMDFFQGYQADWEKNGWTSCHGGYSEDVLECIANGSCPFVLTNDQTSWLGRVIGKLFQQHYSNTPKMILNLKKWGRIDRDRVQHELFNCGPLVLYVSGAVVASTDSNGIMTDLDHDELDHAVGVVGWTTIDCELYWLVRNSWGSSHPGESPHNFEECNSLDKNECDVAYVPWNSVPTGPYKGLALLSDKYKPLHYTGSKSVWICAWIDDS